MQRRAGIFQYSLHGIIKRFDSRRIFHEIRLICRDFLIPCGIGGDFFIVRHPALPVSLPDISGIINIVLYIKGARYHGRGFRSVDFQIAAVKVFRGRSRNEFVGNDIEPTFLASVNGLHSPVEDNIVHELHCPAVENPVGSGINGRMVETGVAAIIVSQDIVMERNIASAPYSSISVLALMVYRAVQGFGYNAPLYRRIRQSVERCVFIRCPAHGTMVDNNILHMAGTKCIVFVLRCRSHPETDISHYDLIGSDIHSVVLQSDTLSGRGLS